MFWRKIPASKAFHIKIQMNLKKLKQRNKKYPTDQFISNLMECVEFAAKEALPVPQAPNIRKIVPGWKSEVKPFRDTAFFWHQVWVSAGKPLNTELHRIMKKTRNTYHFHYRKCSKKSEDIIAKISY